MPGKSGPAPGPKKFKDRTEWRSWLRSNHGKSKGVWVAIQKKGSERKGIRLKEAVEEAMCFGWIDSKIRRIDENHFIQWYSPRRDDSVWSLINKKRAIELMEKGMMTKSGLRSVEAAKRSGEWQIAYSSREAIEIPDRISRTLKSYGVLERFDSLAPSMKLQYVYWIEQAKRQETKKNRIAELIERLRDESHSV